MNAIPSSRKAAQAAGMPRYFTGKPCTKHHLSERRTDTGACVECKKRQRTKTTARKLSGHWLPILADAIEASQAAEDAAYPIGVASQQLALLTVHIITRMRKRAPSPLTFYREIERALSCTRADARSIGGALLGIAAECGLIMPLTRRTMRGSIQVQLSPAAETQREDIERRLVESEIDHARPLHAPAPPVLSITANYRFGKEPAPRPEGDDVIAALAPLQETAWRVNRYMLRVLQELQPADETAALMQAEYWGNVSRFFYRYQFDWRGRLYQLGGRLQYTSGSDAARSLLEFADGSPLDSDGRTWLAVHVASAYGRRDSFMDRFRWTHRHERALLRAAADPIGFPLWRKAKEPYRFLAACDAWHQFSQNPGASIHLPISADATSSAMQHFALLLRDADLAKRVNLTALGVSDKPRDFYGEMAHASGLPRNDVKAGAWFLYGKRQGTLARELGSQDKARRVQDLYRQDARRALELYDRLKAIAHRMTRAGQSIQWTLPDGFRVLQANRRTRKRKTELNLGPGRGRLQAIERYITDALDLGRQKRGLPANLIHSFDGCLLRSIIRESANVSRWAVAHDCVGVHPNDGGTLRDGIRAAIAWMYGPDRLAALLRGWGELGVVDVEACDGVEGGWYTFS